MFAHTKFPVRSLFSLKNLNFTYFSILCKVRLTKEVYAVSRFWVIMFLVLRLVSDIKKENNRERSMPYGGTLTVILFF